MKRIFSLVACLAMLFLIPSQAAAVVGSCVVTYPDATGQIQEVLLTCTGGTAGDAGTIANTTILPKRGWIFLAETSPGTTGPTDNYDIVLNNAAGVDVMGGALMNRDTANTERAIPAVSGWVDGVLTMTVTNNSVSASTYTVKLWVWVQNN